MGRTGIDGAEARRVRCRGRVVPGPDLEYENASPRPRGFRATACHLPTFFPSKTARKVAFERELQSSILSVGRVVELSMNCEIQT